MVDDMGGPETEDECLAQLGIVIAELPEYFEELCFEIDSFLHQLEEIRSPLAKPGIQHHLEKTISHVGQCFGIDFFHMLPLYGGTKKYLGPSLIWCRAPGVPEMPHALLTGASPRRQDPSGFHRRPHLLPFRPR